MDGIYSILFHLHVGHTFTIRIKWMINLFTIIGMNSGKLHPGGLPRNIVNK